MKRILIPTFLMFVGFATLGHAADPVSACQSAVRRQAWRQYNSGAVDFQVNNVNQGNGENDWITGQFFLSRDRDRDTPYQFTCAVNERYGNVRRVSINPGYTGEANREMDNTRVGMNGCQSAVDQRLRNRGYGNVSFNSIRVDNGYGRNDVVMGSVMADRGYGREMFDFSCRVDRDDGDVRSVNLNQR